MPPMIPTLLLTSASGTPLPITKPRFDGNPRWTFRHNVDPVSPELIEQCLGVLQYRRVEALGEPKPQRVVDFLPARSAR
jgi:hypothetical protein